MSKTSTCEWFIFEAACCRQINNMFGFLYALALKLLRCLRNEIRFKVLFDSLYPANVLPMNVQNKGEQCRLLDSNGRRKYGKYLERRLNPLCCETKTKTTSYAILRLEYIAVYSAIGTSIAPNITVVCSSSTQFFTQWTPS